MAPPNDEGRRLLSLIFSAARGGLVPSDLPAANPEDVAALVRVAERTPVFAPGGSVASGETALRVLEVAIDRARDIARAEGRTLGAVLFGDFAALDPDHARCTAALAGALREVDRRGRQRRCRTALLGALGGAVFAFGGTVLLALYAQVTFP